jgi:hypothetical protein
MAAATHQRLVRRDAHQPGRKLRLAAKGAKASIRLKKCVLNGFFCLRIVSQYGACSAEKRPLVQVHEPLEGAHVARENRRNDFGVRHDHSPTKPTAMKEPEKPEPGLPGGGKAGGGAWRSEVGDLQACDQQAIGFHDVIQHNMEKK